MGVERVYNSVEFDERVELSASGVGVPGQLEARCGRESHIRPKGPSGSPDEWGSREDVDKMQ